jgi:hypothetical protein
VASLSVISKQTVDAIPPFSTMVFTISCKIFNRTDARRLFGSVKKCKFLSKFWHKQYCLAFDC